MDNRTLGLLSTDPTSTLEGDEIDGPPSDVEEEQQFQQNLTQNLLSESLDASELLKLQKLTKFGPGCRQFFPAVKLSHQHTILFKIPKDYFDPSRDEELEPYGTKSEDIWDENHVPMPHSKHNQKLLDKNDMYPTIIWSRIRLALSRPIKTIDDLIKAICMIANSEMSCNALKYTVEKILTKEEKENFFSRVIPHLIQICLDLPNLIKIGIPLLKRYSNYSISLNQKQIGSLLANAFFGTFPDKIESIENYPSINFFGLYTCDTKDSRFNCIAQKIRCIIHYFERISAPNEVIINSVLTFTRKCSIPRVCPNWDISSKKISSFSCLANGTIEDDGCGLLQVDFANKFVGGGVLGHGAVQEEILFLIYPELLVSRLFTEKLYPNDALLVTGLERFSTYSGYASSFKYNGDYRDVKINFDRYGRRSRQIVAIDALYVTQPNLQFYPTAMLRELNKAFCGFCVPKPNLGFIPTGGIAGLSGIASGKWGCGAFNGNPQLKIILQLLAASEAERDLVIFTFGDYDLQKDAVEIYELIQSKTVGNVWSLLNDYYKVFLMGKGDKAESAPPSHTLFQFFKEKLEAVDFDVTDSSFMDCCDSSDEDVKVPTIFIPHQRSASLSMNGQERRLKVENEAKDSDISSATIRLQHSSPSKVYENTIDQHHYKTPPKRQRLERDCTVRGETNQNGLNLPSLYTSPMKKPDVFEACEEVKKDESKTALLTGAIKIQLEEEVLD